LRHPRCPIAPPGPDPTRWSCPTQTLAGP
jgi:hypothetical protein